jgi:NTP pyrophosphatase (non-canonical NTP hydrolase)
MHEKNNVELYRRTLEKWGEQAQYDQAIEECAELTTALLHYRRDKTDASTVIDEMADVILMLGQLRWMFGPEEVEQALERKRVKLEGLLMQDEGAPEGVAE